MVECIFCVETGTFPAKHLIDKYLVDEFFCQKHFDAIREYNKKNNVRMYDLEPAKASFSEIFYESREWRELRYKVILKHGRKCQCCLAKNVELHVDHIKPVSKYPELRLDEKNLQVLCKSCNIGKSNKDMTDFRPSENP